MNKLAALSEPLLPNQEGTARCHRSRSCLPAEALHRKLSALVTQRVSSDSGELAQVLPLHQWAKARSKTCRPGAEPITCRDGSLLLRRTAHCAPRGSALTGCLLQGPAAVRGRGGAGGKSAQSICCRPQHRRCAAPLLPHKSLSCPSARNCRRSGLAAAALLAEVLRMRSCGAPFALNHGGRGGMQHSCAGGI